MGLLDQVIGGMFGSESGKGRNSGIADALKELLAPSDETASSSNRLDDGKQRQTPRGLDGLLDSFTRAGHGDVANSWVGSGNNSAVSPQQIEQALDNETIENLSRRTGLSRDDLLRQLSQHLPSAVDRLTPEGRRPSRQDMGHW